MKDALVEPLKLIIHQTFVNGTFPDNLKIAKGIPIFKKDKETLFSNYRPISLLPAFSTVFEKNIIYQLYSFFDDNKLFLYKNQYGFRKGHSTEFAALELIYKLACQMDKGKNPITIFLYLSKAFDTLNHDILHTKLSYYGVKGLSNNLIQSYLQTGNNSLK